MRLEHVLETIADGIFTAYLLWASWQDIKEMQVLRYTHLLGAAAAVLQAIAGRQELAAYKDGICAVWVMLGSLFILAKWLRLYGMADNILFFVCGVYILADRGSEYCFQRVLLLQTFSVLLLLGVQMCKHNIKGWKLRHSVPYIPYISVAFILTNMVL